MLAVWYPTDLLQPAETPWVLIAVCGALVIGFVLGAVLAPGRRSVATDEPSPAWGNVPLERPRFVDHEENRELKDCSGSWRMN